jgi:hypothetical protein
MGSSKNSGVGGVKLGDACWRKGYDIVGWAELNVGVMS